MNELKTTYEDPIMVTSKNELTNFGKVYTQTELDILFYTLTLVKSGKKVYRFNVSQLKKISGRDWNTDELNLYSTRLMQGGILTIQGEKKSKWKKRSLFEAVDYDDGVLTITLTNFAVPLFEQAKERFTMFELRSALRLNSRYSKRLYWLLCEWKRVGYHKYDIEEMFFLFGVKLIDEKKKTIVVIKDYVENKGLFKRLIDQCCVEINRQTDLNVSVNWNKVGRQIDSATFFISTKKELLDYSFDESTPDKQELFRVMSSYSCFTNDEMVKMWDKGLRLEAFTDMMQKVNKKIIQMGEEVSDWKAYIRQCFVNDGYLAKPDKAKNAKDAVKKKQSKDYLKERKLTIDMIKHALAAGASKEAFQSYLDTYQIYDEDLLPD